MTYIYRYMNDNGDIYYVGKANDLEKRHKEHLREDFWCYEGIHLEYILCNDSYAFEVEAYFIDKLNPIYNKIRPKNHLLSFELNSYVIDKHWERLF